MKSTFIQQDGWTNHHHVPIVRVDPESRCAVMLIYGRKLVVLPFRKDPTLDDGDFAENSKTPSKAPILSSYMIVLKNLEEKMDNIIDLQFLHGYYEPTLLILYEPVRTFSGLVKKIPNFSSNMLLNIFNYNDLFTDTYK